MGLATHLISLSLISLAACSSSGDEVSCGAVAGTYAMTEVVNTDDPGTCGTSVTSRPTTLTVTDHGDGTAAIVIERRTTSCAATLDGCTLTATCPWLESPGGGVVGELQLSLTFSGPNASGISAYTLENGAVGPYNCTGKLRVSATRQ